MPIEDPVHPEARSTTPAWPTSQVSATPVWPTSQSSAPASQHSVPTPVRAEELDEASYPEDGEEEFEQFDWDSWQPPTVSSDDDWPKAEEVDWGLGPAMAASAADFPDDGSDAWPDDWDPMAQGSADGIISAPFDATETRPAGIPERTNPSARTSVYEAPAATAQMAEALPTTLDEPLRASGRAWPPAKQISPDVVHVRVPRWAPFATGLALALAMVLASAALVSQTGRLGLTLSVLTGQVPTSADAVVHAYLSAISRGDATKARTYLSAPQTDTLLLTDAVLKRSIDRSPVTVLHVANSSSSLDGTERVAARYTIGTQEVTTTFTTGFSEGQWWISDDPGRIGLGSIRATGIPLFINGEEIPANIDSLPAFPGTYELSTANPYVAFAAPSTIVVRSPDEAPVIGAVRLQLTEAGRQAAYAATRSAAAACVAKHELQPDGCPQNIAANPNEPTVAGTVTYTILSETPLTVAETDLRSATVTVKYVATWRLDVKVYVNGTPRDVDMVFVVTTLWHVRLSDATPIAVLVR
ncbi:MAG: hypothetical protein ACOH16_05340 [Propionibacteriaceae bacterium]